MTSTDLAPIGMQDTPDGMEPCSVCGIPTTGPSTRFPVLGRIVATPGGQRTENVPDGAKVDLPTCSDCVSIQATATAIVTAHPGLRRALGSVATWHVTASLYGLSALGHRLPGPDIAADRLGALVHRLIAPGAAVTFSRRFSPVVLPGASTKLSARSRWSAVTPEVLAECRAAALDWFADTRPARAFEHPGGGQCAWCGTSTAMGRRPSEAWSGDLCRTCAAVKHDGGSFTDAMWQAIDADKSIRRRIPYRPDINGVKPWSQRRGGDGTPWSHLGGIDALREEVAHLVGVTL